MREASSPSFFNPAEVLQVKAHVQQLLADKRAVPRIGKFFSFPLGIKLDIQSSQKSLRILGSLHLTVHNARSFAKHYGQLLLRSKSAAWKNIRVM